MEERAPYIQRTLQQSAPHALAQAERDECDRPKPRVFVHMNHTGVLLGEIHDEISRLTESIEVTLTPDFPITNPDKTKQEIAVACPIIDGMLNINSALEEIFSRLSHLRARVGI